MKVSLADALGTCFGVDDAIQMAMDPKFRGNLTILGQLVHNSQMVKKLQENGVKIVDSLEQVDTPNVMITAHGARQSVKDAIKRRGLAMFDASCPLVQRVHKKIADLIAEGCHVVVLGQASHVEVRGLVGDLGDKGTVVETKDDVPKLAGKKKLGIVCQTTQQTYVADGIVSEIRRRFPDAEIRFVDTICKPTQDRQQAVMALADQVDLMIVIGGYNSSNTAKLKKVCDERKVEAHHIERADEIQPKWFKGKSHVGITAGTSTPHWVIDEIYRKIKSL
jgi:(E)-4-hydroxy-3-methyl-but-2-enyl pyrophosphate reductase